MRMPFARRAVAALALSTALVAPAAPASATPASADPPPAAQDISTQALVSCTIDYPFENECQTVAIYANPSDHSLYYYVGPTGTTCTTNPVYYRFYDIDTGVTIRSGYMSFWDNERVYGLYGRYRLYLSGLCGAKGRLEQ
ncbi:hypothetical protein ABZ793_29105 [Micromonospora sp. NPDC047465]|uniref:hypothetical protein n=1 Tax=Micromonospora sp. NPDC047465 TaxID=3154813 RepID=UPI0033DA0CAC